MCEVSRVCSTSYLMTVAISSAPVPHYLKQEHGVISPKHTVANWIRTQHDRHLQFCVLIAMVEDAISPAHAPGLAMPEKPLILAMLLK